MSKPNIRALLREREKMRTFLANPPLPFPNLSIDYPPRHPSSKTTPELRMFFQQSELSGRKLARQYRKNPKTVYKWRKRTTHLDEPMGPKRLHSYSLDEAEEYLVTHYRRLTCFGLEECFLRLRTVLPKLTRSSLYRCLKRHQLNRVRWNKRTNIKNNSAKNLPGRFVIRVHMPHDEALFSAIEDGSGQIFCRRLQYSRDAAVSFLEQLKEHFPHILYAITLPDEWVFRYSAKERESYYNKYHPFSERCRDFGIGHGCTPYDA